MMQHLLVAADVATPTGWLEEEDEEGTSQLVDDNDGDGASSVEPDGKVVIERGSAAAVVPAVRTTGARRSEGGDHDDVIFRTELLGQVAGEGQTKGPTAGRVSNGWGSFGVFPGRGPWRVIDSRR